MLFHSQVIVSRSGALMDELAAGRVSRVKPTPIGSNSVLRGAHRPDEPGDRQEFCLQAFQ